MFDRMCFKIGIRKLITKKTLIPHCEVFHKAEANLNAAQLSDNSFFSLLDILMFTKCFRPLLLRVSCQLQKNFPLQYTFFTWQHYLQSLF